MNRRAGISLIEVVLAIVILGLAVPPLMIQLAGAVHARTSSAIQTNLLQLASEQMEQVFADHADVTRGYAYIVTGNYAKETAPSGFKGYKRSTEVREVNPADFAALRPGSGIKRFRIVVIGPDDSTLQVESFVTDPTSGGGGSKEKQPKIEPSPKKKDKKDKKGKGEKGRGPGGLRPSPIGPTR